MIRVEHNTGASSAGQRVGVISSHSLDARQNAPVTLTEPGRCPVATTAPTTATGRHEQPAVFTSELGTREQGPRAAGGAPDLIPNAGHDARIARRARAVPVSTRRARSSLTSVRPVMCALAPAGASASAFSHT